MDFATLNPEQMQRWLWLRAVEWLNWPAFLSQLFAPVLLILFPWYYVVGGVVVAGLLWCSVRYGGVNVALANFAAVAVAWLKWPVAVGSALYLFFHDSNAIAALALLWPLIAGFIGIPGKIGQVERAFGAQLGLTATNPSE